jgi:hypothetical protein
MTRFSSATSQPLGCSQSAPPRQHHHPQQVSAPTSIRHAFITHTFSVLCMCALWLLAQGAEALSWVLQRYRYTMHSEAAMA